MVITLDNEKTKKKVLKSPYTNSQNIIIIDYNNFINWAISSALAPSDKGADLQGIFFLVKDILNNLNREFGKFEERYLFLGISPRLPFSQREILNKHIMMDMRRLGFIPVVVEGSVYVNQSKDNSTDNQRYKANLDGLIFGLLIQIDRRIKPIDSLVLISGDSDFSTALGLIRNTTDRCIQLASEPTVSNSSKLTPYHRDIMQYVSRN